MIQRLALLFKSSEWIFSTTQICNSVWAGGAGQLPKNATGKIWENLKVPKNTEVTEKK